MTRQGPSPTLETRQIGVGWWVQRCAVLAVTLVLMAILATALMTLTRMLVDGTTSPDAHLPTLLVWFVLCTVPLVGGMTREVWLQLKDERVHVDVFGNELRIDRWSPVHERESFAERVAADEQARERGRARTTQAEPPAVTAATVDELRAAALRRPEVGPDGESSMQTGRWASPLRVLRRIALVCLYGWLPMTLAAVLLFEVLPEGVDGEWGLLPMLLLPLGWILLEVHHLLRHGWLRTRESRSALAGVHVATAFVGVVLFALLGLTGLIMRSEYLGMALISIPLMALCIWIVNRELRHQGD